MTRYAVLFLALLTACSGGEKPSTQADPSISVFTAAPSTLAKGGSTKLIFAAQDADKLALDNGIGDVTGKTEVAVTPAETTTYTLTASRGAKSAQSKLTVTVGPTPAAGFKLVAAGTLTAGAPADISVTAVDAAGAAVPSYAGTVHLMSNDEKAELPADFTFGAEDKGVKTVQVTFKTAGPHALVASGTVGGGMTGSFSATSDALVVRPGAVKELHLSGLPAETESGMEATLTVSFVDAFGNAITDYPGTLRITTSDDSAPAIPDVQLSAPGSASAKVTFFKAGVQTVTVQDSADASLKASAEVRVKPSTAASFVLSALPASSHAGEPLALTVTALDGKGNRAVRYSGKVHFTSTDAAAQLPADASFDEGVASVSVSFRTAGGHTLTASEVAGSLTVTSGAVQVAAGAARTMVLAGLPVESEPGTALSLQVSFVDAFGNVATEHRGTLRFTLSDSRAPAIADVTLTDVGNGSATAQVTFFTAGLQTVTVQDLGDATLKASAEVRVKAGAATSFVLSGAPSSARAGEPLALTVTALDSKGNVAVGYAGKAHFTSTDAAAKLPADASFSQGVASVSVSFRTAGGQTVTAAEVAGSLTATTGSVSVGPGAARVVRLSGVPAETESGAALSLQASLEDAYGNPALDTASTLHISHSDDSAPAVADVTVANATASFSVTFFKAGVQTLTVQDTGNAALKASANVRVNPAAAVTYVLSALPASARAGEPLAFTVTALDGKGNVAVGYAGKAHFSSTDAAAQLPADASFSQGVASVSVAFHTVGSQSVTAAEVAGSLTAASGGVTVKPGAARAVRLSGLPSQVESGTALPVQASVFDAFGNLATDYQGTLHVSNTDDSAPAVADVAVANATASFSVTFLKSGVQTLTVGDVDGALQAASAKVGVDALPATAYVLSALPASARAGEPVALTLTAVDRTGARVPSYAGSASFSSTDGAAKLPAATAFEQGLANVLVTFGTVGTSTVTATELGGSLKVTSAPVAVTPGDPASIVVAGAGTVTAGNAASFTATVKDAFGNTVTGYAGTVSLTSSDAQAAGLSAYTFTPADAGVHAFSVTLKTAGAQTVTLADGAVAGSGSFTVSAADAASCAFSEVPASVVAGSTFSVRVSMKDAFGNAAVSYGGTVSFSSTDAHPAAVLPEATAYVPGQDGGSRRFNVKLVTGGTQTLTAKDASNLSCSASLTVTPSAARLVVALPTDVNAGSPAAVTVTAQDTFGNVQLTYAGTVAFTSTDTAAVLPGNLTFTGSENGTKTASVTFNTLGAQKLTATQVGDATVTGTGGTAVHGFVYTDPTAGLGKVRLVLNASKSSASVVQLDLVSNTTVTATAGGSGARGGVYSAGMNLPLDTSRAVADATLLVEGTALTLGSAPKAVAAALPTSGATAGILYSGVSQKFSGAGATTGDVTLIPGRVFYSVRLKLPSTATVGTVFDGANLGNLNTKFRAAVRNRAGDDVMSTDDFLLGKLEVR